MMRNEKRNVSDPSGIADPFGILKSRRCRYGDGFRQGFSELLVGVGNRVLSPIVAVESRRWRSGERSPIASNHTFWRKTA